MKRLDGSMTVEMSILFPFITLVIATVILLIFYINDITCIRASAQEYGIISITSEKSEKEICNEIYNSIETETIIANISGINVKKNDEKTTININVTFTLPMFRLVRKDVINVEMYNDNNRKYVINAKVVIDIINKIKNKK